MQNDPNQLLTSEQVANLLQVKVQTLAKWRCNKSSSLRFIKIGGAIRYKRSDLDLFIKNCTN
ncbi:MAG: helix-turn-helix domain-containing protein [Gammaproteobacteria bacterium]|nr:helix-turn-helix domain-containing protein [Gammaproteobacteria bacterium]